MKIFGKALGRGLCAMLILFTLTSAPVLTGCGESKKDRIIRQQKERIGELERWFMILAVGGVTAAVLFLVIGNMMGSKTRRDEWEQEEDGNE